MSGARSSYPDAVFNEATDAVVSRVHEHICHGCGVRYTCLFRCAPESFGVVYCACDVCSDEQDGSAIDG